MWHDFEEYRSGNREISNITYYGVDMSMTSSKHSKLKVTFENKHSVGSMGIISGKSGPEHEDIVRKMEEFFTYAASVIEPNEHSIIELENFIISEYAAVEYTPDQYELEKFKTKLILNSYDHLIKRSVFINEGSSHEDLYRSMVIDDPIGQAKKYPIENLDAELVFYRIDSKETHEEDNTIKIQIDRNTSYINVINNIDQKFALRILTYQGISAQDIAEKNDKFKAYASFLKQMGEL